MFYFSRKRECFNFRRESSVCRLIDVFFFLSDLTIPLLELDSTEEPLSGFLVQFLLSGSCFAAMKWVLPCVGRFKLSGPDDGNYWVRHGAHVGSSDADDV